MMEQDRPLRRGVDARLELRASRGALHPHETGAGSLRRRRVVRADHFEAVDLAQAREYARQSVGAIAVDRNDGNRADATKGDPHGDAVLGGLRRVDGVAVVGQG